MKAMTLFLSILCVLFVVELIIVRAIQPARSQYSDFELKRRIRDGQPGLTRFLRREERRPELEALQSLIIALDLIIITALLLTAFGYLLGMIIAVVVIVGSLVITRNATVSRAATGFYGGYEERVLVFIDRIRPFLAVFVPARVRLPGIGSLQELQHLIETAGHDVAVSKRQLATRALAFEHATIGDVMTSRSRIVGIKGSEILGPLVLDELHRRGHSRVPVYTDSLDTIIGILTLDDHMALDVKRSITAQKAVDVAAVATTADTSLPRALETLLLAHQTMLIVQDENDRTIGLVTIRDILSKLTGPTSE